MDIELLDGEVICPKCNGTGKDAHEIYICDKCLGQKKIDWISLAMTSKKKNYSILDRLNIRRMLHHIHKEITCIEKYDFRLCSEDKTDSMKNMLDASLSTFQSKGEIHEYNIQQNCSGDVNVFIKLKRSIDIIKIDIKIGKEI